MGNKTEGERMIYIRHDTVNYVISHRKCIKIEGLTQYLRGTRLCSFPRFMSRGTNSRFVTTTGRNHLELTQTSKTSFEVLGSTPEDPTQGWDCNRYRGTCSVKGKVLESEV